MFFIIKTTLKLLLIFFAVIGAYALFQGDVKVYDFYLDARSVFEKKGINLSPDGLKNKAAESVEKMVDENKDAIREAAQEKAKEAVQGIAEKLGDSVADMLKASTSVGTSTASSAVPDKTEDKISGCRTGYYLSEVFAAACVQESCEQIPNTYLDQAGRCFCDDKSAGKECYRAPDYKVCPGCVYECVKEGSECAK